MTLATKILGISILQNEEAYCALAIENAMALCDELLILDNNSTDRTHEICEQMTNRHQGRVQLETIDDLSLSHEFVRRYANTDTWIFGVDGDEVYDPRGLAIFRAQVLRGSYRYLWRVRAHYFNIAALEIWGDHQLVADGVGYFPFLAAGWMAPPGHPVSKFYNMSVIDDWPMDEGRAIFQPKIKEWKSKKKKPGVYDVFSDFTWDESLFRCLHLRFIPRTSGEMDADLIVGPRHNMSVKLREKAEVSRCAYRKGPMIIEEVSPFFETYDDLLHLGLVKEI